MAKYTARPPRGDRPLLVLGISGVLVLEGDAAVPVSTYHLSAWGRWVRDVQIPDAAAAVLSELAERFEIVWASEWGHNAHTAFREALALPEEPWAFLPVQFDKARMIRDYAGALPWAWVDDPIVDLHGTPEHTGGVIVRVDPAVGIVGIDPDDLWERVEHLPPHGTREGEDV